jgi:ornithine decarboxylase
MEDRQVNRLLGIARSLVSDHKLPTPFLFIDEARALESLALFKRYLPNIELYYAIKANSSPELIRLFADAGLSFDVASAGELALVQSLGITSDRLFLSTPLKTRETLGAMFQHEVPYAAVDTIDEVERISAFKKAGHYPYAPALFVRIRVESRHVEIDLNKKFGCTLDEALAIIQRAADFGLPLGGVCFHVGSQSTTADNYFLGIERAMRVAKEAWKRFKIRLPVINIGGGFCDSDAADAAGIDIANLYQAIGTACEAAILAGFKVIAEPGRALVASAGAVVTSVAYTLATASRFNGFQPPQCYLVQATGRRGKFLTSIRTAIDLTLADQETAKVAG